MPKVGIVMGSDSDLKVMSKAASMLEKFGIDYEMTIISAHRMPDVFFEWAKAAEGKGIKVIIAGAGMAAQADGEQHLYLSNCKYLHLPDLLQPLPLHPNLKPFLPEDLSA